MLPADLHVNLTLTVLVEAAPAAAAAPAAVRAMHQWPLKQRGREGQVRSGQIMPGRE